MARKSRRIKQLENIVKGRLFEFVLQKLIEKGGFNLSSDIQQLTRSKSKRRMHGRGSTYDPDFVGDFPLVIPFSYPFLLVGEAKFHSKPVGMNEVRAFLGSFIDISQYARINTKSRAFLKYSQMFIEPRYTYIPVVFSTNGFVKNAQALMYTHGIYFVSYENSQIFKDITDCMVELISKINFKKMKNKNLKELTSLEAFNSLGNSIKKEGYDNTFSSLNKIIDPVFSYLGVLDKIWPVHLLSKSKNPLKFLSRSKSCKYVLKENNLFIKKGTKKSSHNLGTISLPKYFLEEYKRIASKFGKPCLKELILYVKHKNRIYPIYIDLVS